MPVFESNRLQVGDVARVVLRPDGKVVEGELAGVELTEEGLILEIAKGYTTTPVYADDVKTFEFEEEDD